MKEAILSAKDVVKQFPGSSQEPVLNHIDIEIYDGDLTIIMGPSGAGKSTLLYALSGMDDISDGIVTYKGEELNRLSEKQMAKLRAEESVLYFSRHSW